MRSIRSLHSRANILPRADLAAAASKMLFAGGEVKTELFGTMRFDCTINYTTPAPRNSFAFGQVMTMGTPDRNVPNAHPGTQPGDIVGFDLFQTGHEVDATPYHETAACFYTLPWKEIACRVQPGEALPEPLGWWLMMEPDPVMTRRLLFGSSGTTLHLAGGTRGGVATNKGKGTKVKLAAAKVIVVGPSAQPFAAGVCEPGDWAIYNPMDALDIAYSRGRKLAFIKWDDLEQVVGP